MEEVVDRVRRQSEFREHHEGDALLMALLQEFQGTFRIEAWVGDVHPRNAGGDADEVMAVGGEERDHSAVQTRSGRRSCAGRAYPSPHPAKDTL
jgi:hypothetical protein